MSNVLTDRIAPQYSPDTPTAYSVLVEPFLKTRLRQLIQIKGKKEAVVVPGTEELRVLCAKYDIQIAPANAGQ